MFIKNANHPLIHFFVQTIQRGTIQKQKETGLLGACMMASLTSLTEILNRHKD